MSQTIACQVQMYNQTGDAQIADVKTSSVKATDAQPADANSSMQWAT